METMDMLCRRQSCRAYLPRQILNDKLETVLKAGNAAPVGMGRYDNVCISVIQNGALLDRLNACTANFVGDPAFVATYGAPTVIVVSTAKADPEDVSYCNAACVVENMHLAATDLGLGSVYLLGCVRALQKDEALQRDLKIPEAFRPMSAIAVGYPAAQGHMRALTTDKITTRYLH